MSGVESSTVTRIGPYTVSVSRHAHTSVVWLRDGDHVDVVLQLFPDGVAIRNGHEADGVHLSAALRILADTIDAEDWQLGRKRRLVKS